MQDGPGAQPPPCLKEVKGKKESSVAHEIYGVCASLSCKKHQKL